MAELERGFETKARTAFKADIREKLFEQSDNIAHRFVQEAHDRLRAYGQREDMNVEPVIDSMELDEAQTTLNGASIRIVWTHEAAGYFEFGTSPHVIRGQPILSFVWENPPQWVREAFPQARDTGGRFQSGWRVFFEQVQHPGMPAARYIRDAMEWLRREVS